MMNVQIFPSRKRVEPNDKLAEKVFSLLAETYYNMVTTGSKYNLVEVVNHKKYGEILTPFWLKLINGYTDKTPLNQFDRAVLAACISEWIAGNKYTTPSIIYRHMTGKIGSDAEPKKEMRETILKSVDRLMCTQLKVDMTDVCEKLGYNEGKPLKITSTILPCAYAEGVIINGQATTVIFLDRESPILRIASTKRQVLGYKENLLDVPKQRNNHEVISIKNYVLQRVQEIKSHNLNASITFEDVFEKCRLDNADNKKSNVCVKLSWI